MIKGTSIPGSRWPLHILLLALLTAVPQQAQAWDVLAVNAPDGGLVFCRAEMVDPKSDLTLAVALSPKQEVNVGIKVPGGGFTKGEGFDVALSLDNDWTKKVVAESATEELLLIRLGAGSDFLKRLAKANVLRIVGDADATEFTLKGSAKATDQLRQCVKESAKAPPQTAAAANAKAPDGFPMGLAALLQASTLKVQPVPLPNVPGRAVDYAWTVAGDKNVEGGFREHPGQTADFATIVARELAPYQQQCGTTGVVPAKVEKLKTLTLQTVDIDCKGEFAGFLYYKTDTGIFAMLVHRGDKAGAKAARDKVAAVVRRLGNEDKKQGE